MAITSIINNIGSKIAAAITGLILKDIIGKDKIAIGPANPPLEMPNKTTPIDAVKYEYKSINLLFKEF